MQIRENFHEVSKPVVRGGLGWGGGGKKYFKMSAEIFIQSAKC